MKRFFLLSLCVFLPAVLPGQDSTATAPAKDHTLLEKLHLRGVHVGIGGGSSPYMAKAGSPGNTAEFRLGFTPRQLPDWTIALTSSAIVPGDTTAYIAPSSGTYHPEMMSSTAGLEIQRRWRRRELVHPIAVASVGQLVNSYNYYHFPKTGGREFHQDEVTNSTFVGAAAGGELNVSGWLRAVLTVGYRKAGDARIVAGVGTNSGLVSSFLFEMGKF